MLQWKQRLYAFLLRRVLGPILDSESLDQLHQSIDVSFEEGKFVLSNVGLNTDQLSSKLRTKLPSLKIRNARVKRLEILLALVEHDDEKNATNGQDDNSSSTSRSSLAWRAMQLGSSSSSSPAVSLVATIEVDGVVLELIPCCCDAASCKDESSQDSERETDTSVATSKTMLASYIDAALASLRLSVQLLNLTIRLYDDDNNIVSSSEADTNMNAFSKWVEVGLAAASYHDNASAASQQEKQTIFNKTLDLQKITLRTGETIVQSDNNGSSSSLRQDQNSTTMALMDGKSQITINVVEYNDNHHPGINAKLNHHEQHPQQPRHVQHDVQVNLERLNLSADARTLQRLQSILESCSRHAKAAAAAFNHNINGEDGSSEEQLQSAATGVPDNEVEADLKTIDGIMKQYYEARLLAQQNHFRNGILLPTDDTVDDGREPTFEAFFDANDQSFAVYSTVLQGSVLHGGLDNDEATADTRVHTKLRVHLNQGSLKLAFCGGGRTSKDPGQGIQNNALITRSSANRSDEYLLVTFSEVQANSSVSKQHSEHSLTISQLDMEDSQVENGPVGRRVEIGSVLRFSSLPPNDAVGELLVQPSCLSLSVRTERHAKDDNEGVVEDGPNCCSVEVELNLEPIELTYRHGTMANFVNLIQSSRTLRSGDLAACRNATVPLVDNAETAPKRKVSLYVSCGSLTLTVPILIEKDWDPLYRRCGYSCDSSWTRRSSFGLLFDAVCFESSSREEEPAASFACNHVIAYAASPSGNLMLEQKSRRFDIFCFSGHDEVDPSVPVSVKFWRNSREQAPDGNGNIGTRTFPKVPAISSFKARQEDDDDDNRIDRVLSSKSEETSRRDLRGNDPQADMLLEASKSDYVVEIRIPEVMGDCSTDELLTLSKMLEYALSSHNPIGEQKQSQEGQKDRTVPVSRTSIALEVDFLSLMIHGNRRDSVDRERVSESARASFALHLDKLKAHVLRHGSSLPQARIVCHEVDLYELSCLAEPIAPVHDQRHTKRRLESFRQRVATHSRCIAFPLFYRSHLFPPISQQGSMLLLDVIDQSALSGKGEHESTLMKVHVTLYDLTYRYDPDSKWMEQLMSIMPCLSYQSEGKNSQQSTRSLITRIFFSLADCNVDYSSSMRYKTPSRMILRVGDLRLSSNIVSPKPVVQAYSVALWDASVYLCKTRYPYNFENSQLPRSKLVMRQSDLALEPLALHPQISAEAIQRAMGFLTIATLESFDAVLTFSCRELGLTSEPRILAHLTVGDLCIFACKDSFERFVAAVGEFIAELTALDERALDTLKSKSHSENEEDGYSVHASSEERSPIDALFHPLKDLKRQSTVRPTAGTSVRCNGVNDFFLDGYDWTTIDQDESVMSGIPPGEEQSARWYSGATDDKLSSEAHRDEEVAFLPVFSSPEIRCSAKPFGPNMGPNIVSHHFPLVLVSDPLGEGDMGLSKFAGTNKACPPVKSRLLVHDCNVKIRFFDGYDWPELLNDRQRLAASKGSFVLNEDFDQAPEKIDNTSGVASKLVDKFEVETLDRRSKLMGGLLSERIVPSESMFQGFPLPEERGASLEEQANLRRMSRRTGKYIQFAASGIRLRVDSLEESTEHTLASCVDIKAQDFFIAETISRDRPVKLTGEWVNDVDHPRDTNDGLLTMKMVTWHPRVRVSPNNEIVNDDIEAVVKILPLRCIIDQKSTRFIRAFFHNDEEQGNTKLGLSPGLYVVPPPNFRSFRFKSFKVKVDYTPERIDAKALRDGALVELINLSPLDGMVLTLDQVEVKNFIGFGEVMMIAVRRWIQDICATQMYKFLTSTRYLEPIAHVGSLATDLIVLPWEAIQNGESLQRALRAGVLSFSGAVAYEACTTTSRATQFFADQVARMSRSSENGMPLPSRPLITPRDLFDTAPHVVESLSRGFQAANYKVVIVPFREYRRKGARGAATSVLKGIPVAIGAPTSGTAEAISFALLGARNQLRPDIFKEEEASQRGLHWGS